MPDFNLPDVDDPRTPLGAALRECEVFCVAACCGMEAFDVMGERLQRWADQVSAGDFERAQGEVDAALVALKDAPESFYFLDCEHTRRDVIGWFESICAAFGAVRVTE